MNNELPFKPGDKVMRIACDPPFPGIQDANGDGIRVAPYNNVFCVKVCWVDEAGLTMCSFVGVDHSPFIGICTHNFRKVEEIRLCINAVKKQTHPLFASDPNA